MPGHTLYGQETVAKYLALISRRRFPRLSAQRESTLTRIHITYVNFLVNIILMSVENALNAT